MDRRVILESFIRQKKGDIERLEKRLEIKGNEMWESEGPKRNAPENPKEACLEEISSIQHLLRLAKNCLSIILWDLPTSPQKCVTLGSLVVLKNEAWIIMSKNTNCGTCSINIDDKKVTCISIKAPLVQAILNKKPGDKVLFNGEIYEIMDVQ